MARYVAGSNREFEEKTLQRDEIPLPRPDLTDLIVSEDTLRPQRLPEGQSRTRKWPVLDAYGTPEIDQGSWTLSLFGLIEETRTLSLVEFVQLPRATVYADMHCVTRWSRLGNHWSGVSTSTLLSLVALRSNATHVLVYAYDNAWTTNLPIEQFFAPDVLLADQHDDEPIPPEHGGPVRLVVPRLFAWKSAKWIRGIEFMEGDKPGFWERGGYHMNGNPWAGERFRSRWT